MKSFLLLFLFGFYVSNVFGQTDTLSIDLNDSTTLKLVKEKFDKDDHKIIYWDATEKAIGSIDGRPVYGTDAIMPMSALTFAELELNNKLIKLETTGMFDPWTERNPTIIYEIEKFLGNPLKIRCLFSYGAGTYLVEWTIVGDKSYLTMITCDNKILDAVDIKE